MTVAAAVIVAAQHERDRKIDLFLAKGLLLSATAGPFLAVVASRVVNRSYQTYDANGVALAVGTGNASQLTIVAFGVLSMAFALAVVLRGLAAGRGSLTWAAEIGRAHV